MQSSCRSMWNMPHGAARTRSPVRTNARKTPTIIDVIKRHFLELVMAHEGRKENAETIKREWLCMFQSENITQFVIVEHQSAWCVGRNVCGYLILRIFPNRKNSQNIVPANNSNNKVGSAVLCRRSKADKMHVCLEKKFLIHHNHRASWDSLDECRFVYYLFFSTFCRVFSLFCLSPQSYPISSTFFYFSVTMCSGVLWSLGVESLSFFEFDESSGLQELTSGVGKEEAHCGKLISSSLSFRHCSCDKKCQ